MALPPALLARLQKRGIIKSATEEVIAESYDSHTEAKEKTFEENIAGAPGCPNKYNPYHLCVEYCYDHWREGILEARLPESYLRKRRRMLGKFPLPEGWVEVYDSGIGRHYYWNQDTDEVCWVSPRHPSAVIGEPAPRVARELSGKTDSSILDIALPAAPPSSEQLIKNPPKAPSKRKRNDSEGSLSSDSDQEAVEKMDDRDKLKRARKKGIDPMDPAAYGEAPVGKWSSGLRAHDKTGADVTASGPLFQQRPYPAPGAILRQQKKKQDEEDDF